MHRSLSVFIEIVDSASFGYRVASPVDITTIISIHANHSESGDLADGHVAEMLMRELCGDESVDRLLQLGVPERMVELDLTASTTIDVFWVSTK